MCFLRKEEKDILTRSLVTNKVYEPVESVPIINLLQVYKYLENDAEVLDVFCGRDNKIVFVFDRNDTLALYDKWCKREL